MNPADRTEQIRTLFYFSFPRFFRILIWLLSKLIGLFIGWTQTQAIDSLVRKAGYYKNPTEEFRSNIKLTRYRSEKIVLSYDEYSADQINNGGGTS